MRGWLIGLVGVLLAAPAVADPLTMVSAEQIDGRFGFEVGRSDDARVVPLGADGFAIIHRDRRPRGDIWQAVLLDAAFQERSRHVLPAPSGMSFGGAAVEDDVLYVVLTGYKIQPRLARVPVSGAAPTVLPLWVEGQAGLVGELEVVGDDVYMLASHKGRAALIHATTAGGEARRIGPPGILGRKASFTRLSPSSVGAQVDATARSRERKRTFAVAGFTAGEPHSLRVQAAEGAVKNVLDAQRTQLEGGAELLVGTYAAGDRRLGAQGLFLARYNGAVRVGMTTHSFADFDGFFDYLQDKRQGRIEGKVKRKQARGSDLKLHIGVILHDVIEQSDRFLVVGEAYFSEYETYSQTVSSTTNGVMGVHTVTRQRFVGYRRTHAFVAAFDMGGTRLWESSLPMGDVLTTDLRRRVRVRTDGDDVELRYVFGTRVVSQGFNDGQNTRIVEGLSDAKTWRAGSSSSAWWYGDHFLVWGLEKVKDSSKPGKKRMFFVASLDADRQGD